MTEPNGDSEWKGVVKETLRVQEKLNADMIGTQRDLNKAFTDFLKDDLGVLKADIAFMKGRVSAQTAAISVLVMVMGGGLIATLVGK